MDRRSENPGRTATWAQFQKALLELEGRPEFSLRDLADGYTGYVEGGGGPTATVNGRASMANVPMPQEPPTLGIGSGVGRSQTQVPPGLLGLIGALERFGQRASNAGPGPRKPVSPR